MPYFETI